MSENNGKLLIITGPSGSGKTSLAKHAAEQLGWQHFEEDNYWATNEWRNERRTPERESVIQQQVFSDVLNIYKKGGSAVLEFILYKASPNPLTNYIDLADTHDLDYKVVVLRPSSEVILQNIEKRGRSHDLEDLEQTTREVADQLAHANSSHINPGWVVDPSGMTVEELYERITNSL